MFEAGDYRKISAGDDRAAQDKAEGRRDAAPALVLTLPGVMTLAQARRLSDWRFRESIGLNVIVDPPYFRPGAD
jgi:hypothetical protein